MARDAFDLTDVSDLPDALRPKRARGGRQSLYLDLLREAGRPVTASEVRAAIFRKHGRVVSSNGVTRCLAMLAEKGAAVRIGHGVYALKEATRQAAE